MRLSELEPRWITRDKQRVAIAFRCPHCRTTWLTCTFVAMKARDQDALYAVQIPESRGDVVGCKFLAWKVGEPGLAAATFENLTVTPSIDASEAKHWHGHITNGEIR